MKLFHLKRESILLFAIFLVALFLRTYNLSQIPVGLHGDEASIGYNAYSLLRTLHDQNGNFLPLAIDQFGDFRPAGYHYLDIPFVALLGLNTLAVRLPAAVFGSFTIFIFYFLLLELFRKNKLALLGSFLLALSPWHIIISRATSESVIASFFVMSGVYVFLKWVKKKENAVPFLAGSFVLFAISFLFYHSARVFVPLFLIPLFIISYAVFKPTREKVTHMVGGFVILITFLVLLLTAGHGTNRPFDVSIFHVPGGATELTQQTGEDGVQNPLITRFLHNKLYFFTRVFASSYFMNFSGEFLFVGNGKPIRYIVPWSGNMFPIELPFLILGFAILLSEAIKSKKYLYLIPVFWLLIGAVPGGLTWEDIPNIQRSSFMVPALLMIVSYGAIEMFGIFKGRVRRILFILIALIFLQNVTYFLHNYFHHSLTHEPWNRSAAEPQLIFTVDNLAKTNKRIIMTTDRNNNFIFYLFYNKFDPALFQSMGSPKEKEGLIFKNFVFTGNPCASLGDKEAYPMGTPDIIYVNSSSCKVPEKAKVLSNITTPDGSPAFTIIKLNPSDREFINN